MMHQDRWTARAVAELEAARAALFRHRDRLLNGFGFSGDHPDALALQAAAERISRFLLELSGEPSRCE